MDQGQIMLPDVDAAYARVLPYVVRTPLLPSRLGSGIFLKCENLQHTGSFKLRGALNKLLLLSPEARAHGVTTSSSGNHGLAVGTALGLVGGQGTVILSQAAKPHKVTAIRQTGAKVVMHPGDPLAAELAAREAGCREGQVYISPYNDLDVVAGQGTIAVELLDQCPTVGAVFVAVGGGGLIGGIASYLKARHPDVQIVGCWPERAQGLLASIRAGRVVEVPDEPTLSDGTAGNLEPGSVTLDLCSALIDDHVVVSEAEIADAVRQVFRQEGMVIEGAAGVAVAGYRKVAARYADVPSVIVLCGRNIAEDALRGILA